MATVLISYTFLCNPGGAYYLFDPNERDEKGAPWRDTPGRGYSTVIRVTNLGKFFEWLVATLNQKDNSPYSVYPCSVLRMSKVNTQPPLNVDEILAKLQPPTAPSATNIPAAVARPPVKQEPPEEAPGEGEAEEPKPDPVAETEEYAPDVQAPETASRCPSWMQDVQVVKKQVPSSRIPKAPARAESVTYFRGE